MNTRKEPLFRKVNTKARGCHHDKGIDYTYRRNTKKADESMKQGVQRGLDYTPLFKFLLSRVGKDWDDVYSEAVSRLDKKDPIFWMVQEEGRQINPENFDRTGVVHGSFRCENSFFNTLYVDDNNQLQKVNTTLSVNDLYPSCECCTHTFNGAVIKNKPQYN
jgi:hypothetical protein